MNANRLPLLMFAMAGAVVVVVIALATSSRLVFGVAVVVHAIATTLVATGAFKSVLGGSAVEELEALERQPSRR